MLVFDKGFMHLRQEYLYPLASYSIRNNSINANSIKNVLRRHQYTGFEFIDNNYIFEFDEDTILKAQLADAWKAYIRTIVQRDSATQIYTLQPDYCPNWSIVTDYYFAFFCACTVLRLTMRGNMYIDPETSRKVSAFISDLKGEPLKIPEGNAIYFIQKSSSIEKYELVIQKTSRSTHESIWYQMEELIKEMSNESGSKTDEKIVLESIKSLLKSLGPAFPSTLRNEVNYQLKYGYMAVNKDIQPCNACGRGSDNWVSNLIAYDGKEKTLPVRQARFCEYTEYIFRLMLNLEHEYREIEGKNKSLWAFINDKRVNKITEPAYSFNDK